MEHQGFLCRNCSQTHTARCSQKKSAAITYYTADFLQDLGDHQPIVSIDLICTSWIHGYRRKRTNFPWEEQAILVGNLPASTAEYAHYFGRAFFQPTATPKDNFDLRRFVSPVSDNCMLDLALYTWMSICLKLSHFVAPCWADDFPT